MFFYNQWITGKGNYTFPFRPVLITDVRIIDEIVCQMRHAFMSDNADFKFANRYAAMRTVDVGIHSSACLKFQDILFLIECPNARKCRIKIVDNGLGALLENFTYRVTFIDRSEEHTS